MNKMRKDSSRRDLIGNIILLNMGVPFLMLLLAASEQWGELFMNVSTLFYMLAILWLAIFLFFAFRRTR